MHPEPPPSPVQPRSRARRWLWPVLVVVALALVAGWWWKKHSAGDATETSAQQGRRGPGGPGGGGRRGPGGPGGPNSTVPVKAEAAKSENLDVFIKALGTVTSFNTVTVRSRVDGELVKVLFREGQQVKEGDLLAQIDPRSFQVAVEQAEGALEQNKAQLDNARRDLQRYQTLFAQDSIAKQQVDTQAALVRQYEGTIKTNQAAVDAAKLQLDYTRVRAPASGRLGLRQVDQGNQVHSSDANGLVIITQTQPISVVFTIAETDLPAVLAELRGGNRLAVEAYDRADLKHIADGVLDVVDNAIDVTTGTVKLKARFENKDQSLFPNQFINVRLHVRTLVDATVIPAASVQRGTPGTFVYVINPDKTTSLRVIKLGMLNGERIAVTEGLKPGEMVVTDGIDSLRPGVKVEVVTGTGTVAQTPAGQMRRAGGGAPTPGATPAQGTR